MAAETGGECFFMILVQCVNDDPTCAAEKDNLSSWYNLLA